MAGAAVIRDATSADAAAIAVVYNALIASTTVAWTESTESVKDRTAWLVTQGQRGRPVLVAEVHGEVIGFASYGDFRDSTKWPGYRFTVEDSIYLDPGATGRGIGRALLTAVIDGASLTWVRRSASSSKLATCRRIASR